MVSRTVAFTVLLAGFSIVAHASDGSKAQKADCVLRYDNERPFASNRLWLEAPRSDVDLALPIETLNVILFDQNRAVVRGFVAGYAVTNREEFHAALGSEKFAEKNARRVRGSALNLTLRISLGEFNMASSAEYDLKDALHSLRSRSSGKTHAEAVKEYGLELVMVDSREASFGIGRCEST